MKKYKIISDGSCDLYDEYIKEKNLEIIPFYVSFDKTNYLREKQDLEIREFYQEMIDNPMVFPTSSLPSVEDYLTVFTKYAKENIDMICLCITKKFSGSYNSANVAKEMVLEDFPNANIQVIDTMVNTVLQGLMVKEVVKMNESGYTLEQTVNKVNEIKETARIFFTVNGLEYLKNGGRIGKVSALIGGLLKINPIITLKEGEIFSSGKGLSRARAVAKVKDTLLKHVSMIDVREYSFAVGYGYDIDEAIKFRNTVAELLSIDSNDISVEQIGATIAVHTGPYALGLGLIKKFNA